MELVTKKRLHLISGRTNRGLAVEVAAHMGVELSEPNLVDFANGEIKCTFADSLRGGDVFIIQSHGDSPDHTINDSIMEHLIMIDAAKRASAKRITAVMPFYGYARQDRKAAGREPITAKLLASLFHTAGAERLVSVDLHSGQIQGFFDGPVDHLTAMPVLLDYIQRTLDGPVVVCSPDTGRVKVAERYARHLDADVAAVYKRRSHASTNAVEARGVMGEVAGMACVLVDDMIDTAGTICAAADILLENGATEVMAASTHAVFSGPAVDRLKNSAFSRVVVTNTLPIPSEKEFDKLEVLSVAGVLADALESVFEDTSVSEIFGGENQS